MAHILFLNGTVGVGKTSVANSIMEFLHTEGVANACIDMDALRDFYPRPQNDPFGVAMGYKNLASLVKNYQSSGIETFIIPTVLEEQNDLLHYEQVFGDDAKITVVRLVAPLDIVEQRLRKRETGAQLDWSLNRAPELHAILERSQIGTVVDATGNLDDITRNIIELFNN